MSRYAMCPVCGHRMHKVGEDTYECYHCPRDSDYDEYDEETLDVYDAAEIWASHGKDEDYTFGYSEEELEAAL